MNKILLQVIDHDLPENHGLSDFLDTALSDMEEELASVCRCRNALLQADLERVIQSGGKRLRPILCCLGYLVGKADPEREDTDYPIVPMMAGAELVHTSSLIHDDIVDEAEVRRSVPTINHTSGNYAAVQAGDYLLAKASELAQTYKDLAVERHFAQVAKEMCEAEFLQIECEYRYDEDSLDNYFKQIRRKTAAFIAAAVTLGGRAGGAGKELAEKLEQYGINLGVAFQIRDDVLDFAPGKGFGKKCGQDLLRGIFTLPLLYALQGERDGIADEERKNAVCTAVSREKSAEDVNRLLTFVRKSNALERAQKEIERYTEQALEALAQMPECPAKGALRNLAAGLAVRSI